MTASDRCRARCAAGETIERVFHDGPPCASASLRPSGARAGRCARMVARGARARRPPVHSPAHPRLTRSSDCARSCDGRAWTCGPSRRSGLTADVRRVGAPDDSTSYEFWPEINAYVSLDERSRLLFTAAATRAMEGAVEGGKASFQDAQFTVNFDYTLAPSCAGMCPRPNGRRTACCGRAWALPMAARPAAAQDCVQVLHRHRRTELALSGRRCLADQPPARGFPPHQRRALATLPRARRRGVGSRGLRPPVCALWRRGSRSTTRATTSGAARR